MKDLKSYLERSIHVTDKLQRLGRQRRHKNRDATLGSTSAAQIVRDIQCLVRRQGGNHK